MGALRELAETLFHAPARRHRHRPLLDATMATAALIAYADGEVTFSESSLIDRIVEGLEPLQSFDVHEAVDLFKDYVDTLRVHPEKGHARALRAVARMKDDPETADLILRVAAAISDADGSVSGPELESLREIRTVLGLPAAPAAS